jgi:hypothetical protein
MAAPRARSKTGRLLHCRINPPPIPLGMRHLRTDIHEAQERTPARAANDLVLAGVRDAEADVVEPVRVPEQHQEGGTLIFSYPQEKTLTIDTGAIFRPQFHRARV